MREELLYRTSRKPITSVLTPRSHWSERRLNCSRAESLESKQLRYEELSAERCSPRRRLSCARAGIERETVLAMLGPESENRHANFRSFGTDDKTQTASFWTGEKRAIGVIFNADGRVHAAVFTGNAEKPGLIEQVMEYVTKWVGSNQKT